MSTLIADAQGFLTRFLVAEDSTDYAGDRGTRDGMGCGIVSTFLYSVSLLFSVYMLTVGFTHLIEGK